MKRMTCVLASVVVAAMGCSSSGGSQGTGGTAGSGTNTGGNGSAATGGGTATGGAGGSTGGAAGGTSTGGGTSAGGQANFDCCAYGERYQCSDSADKAKCGACQNECGDDPDDPLGCMSDCLGNAASNCTWYSGGC
ncbi:MAG: hypothetical protein R3B13_20925 [Polyangiaceae bacterium]